MARRRAGVPFSRTRTASYVTKEVDASSSTPAAGGGTICPTSRPRPRRQQQQQQQQQQPQAQSQPQRRDTDVMDDAESGTGARGGGRDCDSPYFVLREVLRRGDGGSSGSGSGSEDTDPAAAVLAVRIIFLTERECALAYVQVEEKLEAKLT